MKIQDLCKKLKIELEKENNGIYVRNTMYLMNRAILWDDSQINMENISDIFNRKKIFKGNPSQLLIFYFDNNQNLNFMCLKDEDKEYYMDYLKVPSK